MRTPRAIHKAVRRKALRSSVETYRHKSSADNISHKPSSASAVAVRAMAQGPKLLANTMAANIPARGPQALWAVKASAIHASHADSAEGSRKANSFKPKRETLRACNQYTPMGLSNRSAPFKVVWPQSPLTTISRVASENAPSSTSNNRLWPRPNKK